MDIDYESELKIALQALFPDPAERARVSGALETYGGESWHREPARVKLGILRLVSDQPDRLEYYVEEACKDYRDILAWAEYPETFRVWRLRETDPARYRELADKEAAEYLAWLRSLHQAEGPG